MFSVVFAFLVLGCTVALFDDGHTDTDENDPPPPDEPSTDFFQVTDGATINGSRQDDEFSLSDEVAGDFTAELNGGAGDDTFDLTRPDGSAALISGSLDGGAGNDLLRVSGENNDLRGGEGNDTVFGDLLGGSVDGEGGDDLLRISAGPGDPVRVSGGDGNDTLDGRGSENIVLAGGAGDDMIVTDGAANGGAGYNIIARGGDGDDTLSHSVEVFPQPDSFYDVPARLTGGKGADVFSINLTIGEGSVEAPAADSPGPLDEILRITDFTVSEDRLEIEVPPDLHASYSGLTIETAGGNSTLALRFAQPAGVGGPDVTLTIRLDGVTLITAGDVTVTRAAPLNPSRS